MNRDFVDFPFSPKCSLRRVIKAQSLIQRGTHSNGNIRSVTNGCKRWRHSRLRVELEQKHKAEESTLRGLSAPSPDPELKESPGNIRDMGKCY